VYKKKIIAFLAILLVFLILGCGLAGCSSGCTDQTPSASLETEQAMITVVDSFGRKVSVPKEVTRIAALYSFAGYTVSLLGRGSDLIAVPGGLQRDLLLMEIFPEIADAAVPRVSGKINIEELMRVSPDLVIIRGDTAADKKELEKLGNSGIPYIIVEYSTIEEQQEAVSIIGKAIGRTAEAEKYNAYYNKILQMVDEAVSAIPPEERTRVYHSENQPTRTIHRDSIAADWSKAAGIINVSINAELELIGNDYYCSLEQVLMWDPEVIIANENSALAYIKGNPQWSGIKAVQNNRVYQLPLGISRWGHPGSVEIPLAVLWTAKTVYPEILTTVNMAEEVDNFYRTFFNFELSDEQIEKILKGEGLREPK
jgi:iron complex transport system substrate-binding protein